MASMKIEIHSRKLIKPSIKTPPELRLYKISFIDEFAPIMNIPLVLFFSNPNSNSNSNPQFVSKIEKSLRKTLTRFRPLAGRYIKDMHTVDCNDQGAEFIQARVNVTLDEILDPSVETRVVTEFIPSVIGAADEVTDPILAAQVTMLQCGGIAIGVGIAHRVADACTVSTFLNEWAAFTRNETEVELDGPGFNSSSLLPGRGLSPLEFEFPRTKDHRVLNKFYTKKISFNESAISKMKAKAKLQGRADISFRSKVQLVAGLIWKAFMTVDEAIHGHPRASVLVQPVNLREKTASQVPKTLCGNFWGLVTTECRISETSMESEALVDLSTVSVKKAINGYSKICHDSDQGQMMILDSYSKDNILETMDVLVFTSWCKFPFYEADFGMGRPKWISCGSIPHGRSVFLLDDAQGSGIDAYVRMAAEYVPYFEQFQDIKSLAA